MEFVLIKEGSSEWDYMWNWLGKHPINNNIDNPTIALNDNEAWQYMGSWKQDNKAIHTFRHRQHPITRDTRNVSVSASKDFTADMVEPKK